MTEKNNPKHTEHEIDQAIDHALGQQDSSDQQTLDDSLLSEMENAAALLDLSAAHAHPADIPDGLADRIKSQVAQYPAQSTTQSVQHDSNPGSNPLVFPQEPSAASSPAKWVPWMVAAASLLIATISIIMPREASSILDLRAERLALIDSTPAEDLTQWDWISTDDSAVVGDVIGDVVWSDTLNKGYMRISGLAINDPSLEQYQLWIFDATRPTGDLEQFGEGLLSQRPIDGGVFDLASEGEIIIKIDAKLTVQQAAAFAITVEAPGGVVVSDRSRVPLLALAP
jgi:hypothetical protein